MHLYIHIPFCHHICPYCGFYKHTPGALANAAFVEALLTEARKHAEDISAPLETIYFGGGTPSLLSPTHLDSLCRGLADTFDLSQIREWTLEANPATFDLAKAKLIRQLGVTRISLGVQSFAPDTLITLGRDHSPADAIEAFETLREAGFQNISVDLMFSIPGQTQESWKSDLEQVVALQPDHISAYNLTYEEDTDFLTRHQFGELDTDEDRDADLFYAALDFLQDNDFEHYEISNYARPGFESQHNRSYWSGSDYLGIGPGAVSTINKQRWTTLADTAAYVRAAESGLDTRTNIEILTDEDLRLERIALLLRTREGLPTEFLPAPDPVESLIEQGLIIEQTGFIRLTRAGKALADPIAAALV